MDALVPPNVAAMVPYKPGKPLEELERELGIRNAIKLASNENPVGPSPQVVAAVREAAQQMYFYPDGAAFSLRRDLAEHHQISMDEICLGNGSNELIDLLCRTFPSREEHVVFGKPSFVCYWLGCTAAGVAYTEVPLTNHLAWDTGALLDAVRPSTKLLFLANPNNPTGAYVGESDLKRLLLELPPQVVCVVDEAYVDFVEAQDYVSALSLRSLRERLIVLRTFSKSHGLAGMRVGYAIGPPSMIDYLHRMRAPFNVNILGQVAARAALRDRAHVDAYVELNAKERKRVTQSLESIGLHVAPSQTNFVLVDTKRSGAEMFEALLRLGVIVRPMPAPIDAWLRVSIGTKAMNDRFLKAIEESLT